MSYQPFGQSEYLFNVARGLVPGQETVVMRGHRPTQASADGVVDVWEVAGDLDYLASAETQEITSTDAADAAPAGNGMRTALVLGVSGTGAAISEVVEMDGMNDVTTVNSYLRVNFLVGLTAGSVGWNVGTISATATTAATVQCQMDAIQSISHNSQYTVPLGKTLFIMQAELNVGKIGGGGLPVADFMVVARAGGPGAPFIQLFDKKLDAAVGNELDVMLPFPAAQAIARTDLKFRMSTDTNGTEVRTRLYGILIDD